MNKNIISIIIPVYNEEEVLEEFHKRLSEVLKKIDMPAEIIYVNDGSSDNTFKLLQTLHIQDSRIAILDLSRNFGKEIAMIAGIDYACGDAIIIIDADLQDPPEIIPELIEEWQNGFDIVYTKRITREGDMLLKRITARIFYYLINKFIEIKIPENAGDYKLFSRRAAEALKNLREVNRFMKGLSVWIGFPQKEILYKRVKRFAGKSKWNYFKLWNLAMDCLTSFSMLPLKIATYTGVIIISVTLIYSFFILKNLVFEKVLERYSLLILILLFLGGIQLIYLGVIGEYLGRISMEVKKRPLYFVKNYIQSSIKKLDTTS